MEVILLEANAYDLYLIAFAKRRSFLNLLQFDRTNIDSSPTISILNVVRVTLVPCSRGVSGQFRRERARRARDFRKRAEKRFLLG